jgi:transmembrane 9 superfamily protein 2/4
MYVPAPIVSQIQQPTTPSQIKMLENNGTCRTLCLVKDVTGEEAKFINDRIREDYAVNWLIDGLPAAEMKVDVRSKELFFDMGFNLGDNEGKRHNVPALNNHYEIVLRCETFVPSFQLI